MRRIVVVLGVAVVMAAIGALTAGAALAQPEPWTNKIEVSYSFTDYNPCMGEEILWEAIITYHFHVTANYDGPRPQYHATTLYHANFTGTGLETGDEYTAVGAGRWAQNQNGPDTDVWNKTAMGVTISKEGSPNFLGRYQVRTPRDEYIEVLSRECTANVEPQSLDEPIE